MESRKRVQESRRASAEPLDRLSALLERFRVRAALFHSGALCGTTRFDAVPGRAFVHVLRRGALEVRHPAGSGLPRRLHVREPTLLLYPRPVSHVFVNPPREGSDFTCATLHFDDGERHPLVRALPALVRVPLAAVEGLSPALELLFAETDRVRCGSRLLADRLFEVVLIQLLRWLLDHPERSGVTSGLAMGLADPRLARALVAVHREPEREWTLATLARTAGMSRSAFAAAFRAAVGATPMGYVGDWRLTLAATRLRTGEPVKRVAAELGYASASSLSKAFRVRFGDSPRRWGGAAARASTAGSPVPQQ